MTEERAKELGIFTAWNTFSCQFCLFYSPISQLSEHNGAIICQKCQKQAQKRKDEQLPLFDTVQTLF